MVDSVGDLYQSEHLHPDGLHGSDQPWLGVIRDDGKALVGDHHAPNVDLHILEPWRKHAQHPRLPPPPLVSFT